MGKQQQKLETDQDRFHYLQRGHERDIQRLYYEFRSKFVPWAMGRYRCDEDQAGDVFQRSFTIFYLNVKNGKLKELTASLETYLFGIGKNVFREQFKDKFRQMQELDDKFDGFELDYGVLEKHNQSHLKVVCRDLLDQLGEPCRTILLLYYYQKFAMESIAEEVGYKNEMVAKKKKYQCLQGLRKLVEDNPILKDELLNL